MVSRAQIISLLSLALLAACEKPDSTPTTKATGPQPSEERAAPPAKKVKKPEGPKKPKRKTKKQLDAERKTFAAELKQLDTDIIGIEKLIKAAPDNRMNHERLAATHMQHARLTGSYDDYALAEASVATAFEHEPRTSALLLRAKLHYSLHRLPQARADFEAAKPTIRPTPDGVASREAFEANLAMQAGDSAKAEKHFDASLASKRTTSSLSSVAVYRWKTGDFEQAEALFREALKSYHGKPMEPRAWLHLNLGLLDLDRGRYDDALAHYREAETFMKGYWLIDEHIAEILTLQGKTEEAKTLYLDILERTQNPEFMDAMAGIAFEAGDSDEGKRWVEKAQERYEEQTAKYPEAAYGHALGHYLEFGDDPAFALELARKNYDLRPNLDASIMLAQAHLKAGDARAAEKALKNILKSKFKSAELFVTAAEVHHALRHSKKASTWLEKARAIDPTSKLESTQQAASDQNP